MSGSRRRCRRPGASGWCRTARSRSPARPRSGCRRRGPFLRFGGDHARAGQDPADRRRRDRHVVVVAEVPGDRVRAVIQSLAVQVRPQVHDQLDRRCGCRRRRGLRPPRPRRERRLALEPPPADELRHPPFRDAVGAGDVSLGTPLDDDRGDDQTSLRHLRSVPTSFRCLERSVSYVLNENTAGGPTGRWDRSVGWDRGPGRVRTLSRTSAHGSGTGSRRNSILMQKFSRRKELSNGAR